MYLKRAGLIALMAVGSIAIWIANPLFWFWVTSRLQTRAGQAQMGPYLLLLLGIILTAVALGKGLSALNRRYGRLTGTAPTVRIVVPWRRSLRDARHGGRDDAASVPVSLLDVVMVVSVIAAVIAFATWYLITNPAPPGVEPGSSKD
jgi:hypothetical protein